MWNYLLPYFDQRLVSNWDCESQTVGKNNLTHYFLVLATAEDPVPGWTNNIYGPTGVIYGIARGVIRVFHTNPHNPAVFVPVGKVKVL